jgi:hypothetical protein
LVFIRGSYHYLILGWMVGGAEGRIGGQVIDNLLFVIDYF